MCLALLAKLRGKITSALIEVIKKTKESTPLSLKSNNVFWTLSLDSKLLFALEKGNSED